MTEVRVVKKRKDFIKVAKQGEKVVQPTLILQAAFNLSVAGDTCQIGYTVTKKIGKAVVRNRCRRRLRAAAALFFGKLALPNADYVLIARYSTANVDFKELCRDLQYGVKKLNRQLNGETACVQEDDQTPVSVAD